MGGSCNAVVSRGNPLNHSGICGNPTVWFCDECGSHFCDLHIGEKEGLGKWTGLRDLCIKCKVEVG